MTITFNALAISYFIIIVFATSLLLGLIELWLQNYYKGKNSIILFFERYTPFQHINVISGALLLIYLMFIGAAYIINKGDI